MSSGPTAFPVFILFIAALTFSALICCTFWFTIYASSNLLSLSLSSLSLFNSVRLSSHFHDFMQSYRILKSNLSNYGYTRSFIRICKQSALSLTNCQRNSIITGCQPCRSKQCRMCFYTRSTAILTSNLHNHTFPITQNTCCNTRNCIYTIHCTLCTHIPTIYVGETKNCIRSRFSQHKHNITTHTTRIQSYLNISIKPITTYLCSEFLCFNSLQRIPKILVKLISCAKNLNYCG